MLNSSLTDTLKSLNKEEFKRFEDVVRSPYFNKNSNVTNLFMILKKYFPLFDNEKLKRQIAWSEIFPGKPFNYGVMKNLIYGLQKLVEKFIELQSYELNFYEQKKNLMDGLMKKELISLFEKNLQTVKTGIANSPVEPGYYYYKYIFEAMEQNYFYQYTKYNDLGFCKPMEMSQSLSSFFFTDFFSENYNSLLQSKFYDKKYGTGYIKNTFDFFENSLASNDENVRLFYLSLKILINADDNESFYALRKTLEKNVKKLNYRLSFNVSMSLVNFCSYRLMKGSLLFVNDLFEICRLMIENGLYYGGDTKHIDKDMFVKVVGSACNADKFEWAEKFIEDFKEKLHPDYKEQFLTMALVNLNIKKKKF